MNDIRTMTEPEMRDAKAPWPKSTEELVSYIESLTNRGHDYGTCVYAMSLAATAAFQYVAGQLGVTGFQASCADLDILRRTRGLECPFIILKADDMVYPQYNIPARLREAMTEWEPWAAEKARKLIAEHEERHSHVHPDVLAHWQRLALTAASQAADPAATAGGAAKSVNAPGPATE